MPATVIEISKYRRQQACRNRIRHPRKKLYYLGAHSYSGMPGLSWGTRYWIKRVGQGNKWELYCTAEGHGNKGILYDTFSRAELLRYFDEVQFEIDVELFEMLGILGDGKVIDLDDHR